RMNRGASGAYSRAHAGEHHAKILLDLEDSFSGATRQISLQAPKVDERGRLALETRTLEVKIPKGIRAGQIIRLAGQGTALRGERSPGDLLLEVGFRPHARFRPDGRDLHLTLAVAPWEAALGAIVPVALPGGGALKVRIPAGALSGQMRGRHLRVRGKGLPSDPPGDLYIDLSMVTPPAATPKQKELYEALAKESGFDPRKEPES
ncbi:MAG: J domain-containing protein, partial [Betaproteobacteria bacterium]|nr:J domain-containing protein [Betaproteobacteria bacterium]